MLIDEIKIAIKAGDGGEGKISFGKMEKSGPDGGNGGKGADIYVEGSSDLTLLNQFLRLPSVIADSGVPGGKEKRAGKNANDLTLYIPIGSTILDMDTKEVFDITEVGQKILLAVGGAGGIGNFDLRSSLHTTPKFTVPAKKGQERHISITLRFIADFGLIGLPNAGKSSLLNELTNANVKTGDYRFTTLSPNLGVLPKSRKIIADIPGLIEGASDGRGLGINFLKHIQKVNLLLHCIASDSENMQRDYETVRNELGKFSKELLDKKEVILLTKHDLISSEELRDAKKKLKKLNKDILEVSIHDEESLKKLSKLFSSTSLN